MVMLLVHYPLMRHISMRDNMTTNHRIPKEIGFHSADQRKTNRLSVFVLQSVTLVSTTIFTFVL